MVMLIMIGRALKKDVKSSCQLEAMLLVVRLVVVIVVMVATLSFQRFVHCI